MITIKNLVKKVIDVCLKILMLTKVGRYTNTVLIENVMNRKKLVKHNNIKMYFSIPNQLAHYRVETFSSKEPETLDWIDELPKGSILWDIGANIGLYSVYAAKRNNCNVFAFEPSVFNLEILARNIFLNNLQDQIAIMPLALSNKIGFNTMHITNTDWSGALSTYGEEIGWDGKKIDDIFSYQTFGLTMNNATELLDISKPDYIKIDVDGIEHLILSGGKNILKTVKGILIEINDNFKEQAISANSLLKEAGFILHKKLHSKLIENSEHGFSDTYNQIWIKKLK